MIEILILLAIWSILFARTLTGSNVNIVRIVSIVLVLLAVFLLLQPYLPEFKVKG